MRFVRTFGRERKMRALAGEARYWLEAGPHRDERTRAAFTEWLLRSPQHVQVWLEITAFCENAAKQFQFPASDSVVAAVGASQRGSTPAGAPGASPKRPRPLEDLGITLLLASLIGYGFMLRSAAAVARPVRNATALGEHPDIVLHADSRSELNARSTLDVFVSSDARRMRETSLSGSPKAAHVSNSGRRSVRLSATVNGHTRSRSAR